MSLLPFLFKELLQPTLYNQHFGLGLFDNDLLLDANSRYPDPLQLQYPRPFLLRSAAQSGLSNIKNDHSNFVVNLDVQQFKPEEVTVKVADGYVVVDGKHGERSDEHGYISRQFTRRYKVPDNVDLNAIRSSLSFDGILSIAAPKKAVEGAKGERPIQIVLTNQPSIYTRQNKGEGKDNGKKMDTDQ